MRKFLKHHAGHHNRAGHRRAIMLAQGYNPLASYAALFEFSLGDPYTLATTLRNAVRWC